MFSAGIRSRKEVGENQFNSDGQKMPNYLKKKQKIWNAYLSTIFLYGKKHFHRFSYSQKE